MTRIDYDKVRQVSGVVRLRDVVLTHAHWLSTQAAFDLGGEAPTYSFRLVDASWDHQGSVLEVLLEYGLVAFAGPHHSGGARDVQLFQLECGWKVAFGVPATFRPASGQVMADFVVANGQLNAFPYVRQFVQDLTGRAGWPPLILPTFRIPATREKDLGPRRRLKARVQE